MRHLRHPLLWMVVALAVSFLLREAGGGLEPVRLPDTASYERLARLQSLDVAFGHTRTLGYPLLLRAAGEHRHALKRLEYGTYLLAVLALWWALTVWFRSGWIALAGSVPLLVADVLAYTGWLQPEILAPAFALLAVAALILVVGGWRPGWSWSVLVLGLFLACLLRPAYLFLVPVLPVAGFVMRWIRDGFGGSAAFGLRLTAASAGPVLGFCLVRWLIVGQLGFVAFLGYNLSGVAASFLNPSLVDNLPVRQRPLAEPILAWRQARGWQPYEGHWRVDPWHEQFTPNIYHATVPVVERSLARRPAAAPTPWIAVDERLREWSLAVLRRNPPRYLHWVRGNLAVGLHGLLQRPTITVPLVLVALSVPFLLVTPASPARDPRTLRAWFGLAVLCGGYFLGNLLLLATISVPLHRYVDAAVLLLPVLIWVECAILWRRILWPVDPVPS